MVRAGPGLDKAPDPSAGPVDAQAVRRMFDGIARHYDILNTVLSVGRDAAWRRRAVRAANLRRGNTALDVCCGTGALSRELLTAVSPGGRVVGIDFSPGMLAEARRRVPGVDFRRGDATRLDGISDGSVDAVTIAFGLRNIGDRRGALLAAHRVLRPERRLVLLEFSQVRGRVYGGFYRWYLTRLLPRAGRLLNPRSEAYSYLPASIAVYPDAGEVSAWLRSAGFVDVHATRMTAGVVTLHVASRPAAGPPQP
ncbi:MAG TPA: ubiquinone/menaquinone biosynthesis methyltransferase [Candidatus Dormibacteraeota bacterium]